MVFAVEKIVTSKLYEKGANRRIFNIDTHVGMAAAGLVTDARQLASIARDEASSYRQDYGSAVPLPQLTQRVSGYMHAYTLYSSVRPFGATGMLGSWTEDRGAELYCLEPSGISYGYWGCAAGKAKSNAKTELEKLSIKIVEAWLHSLPDKSDSGMGEVVVKVAETGGSEDITICQGLLYPHQPTYDDVIQDMRGPIKVEYYNSSLAIKL